MNIFAQQHCNNIEAFERKLIKVEQLQKKKRNFDCLNYVGNEHSIHNICYLLNLPTSYDYNVQLATIQSQSQIGHHPWFQAIPRKITTTQPARPLAEDDGELLLCCGVAPSHHISPSYILWNLKLSGLVNSTL